MGAVSLGRSFPSLHVRPLGTLSDERLAALVRGGNDEAFEILFERYRAPLSRYCRSIVRDPEDARDAQQSAMLAALRALRERRLTGRVRPWLYRIAHNEAITVLRRRRGHDELDERTPSPRGELQQLEQWEVLISDLRSLPERQRGALLMRELGGLEYSEIGTALGMSPVRARKVVFDARSALADTAAGRDADCADVRLKLSDGDGRALRARRMRSHLEACTACAAFALSVTERRRALELIPVAPAMSVTGALGGGLGLATAGGVGGGGIAAGGVALGTGSAGLAAKGIASAVCALCALAGAGVVLGGAHHALVDKALVRHPVRARAREAQARPPQAKVASRNVRHRIVTQPGRAHRIQVVAIVRVSRHPRATAGQLQARVPTARIGTPPDRGRPVTKLASTRPAKPPSQTTTTATTPTSTAPAAPTPVATTAAVTQTPIQQLIGRLIQGAMQAAGGWMSPTQRSELTALEQQWHGTASGASGQAGSELSSLQAMISKILGGGSWPGMGGAAGATQAGQTG